MKITKIVAILFVVALGMQSAYAKYPEVSCSSNAVFDTNTCNQCFDGGSVSVGDNIGLLTDELLNEKTNDILVYKEEQKMPEMVALNDAVWSQTPSADDFWEFTDTFNALYSADEDGYIIDGDSKLTWLQSKLGYAYTLDKNTQKKGSDIGLLIYKTISHDITADGDITLEGDKHRECVLFSSADESKKEVPKKKEPKKLPDTGPEHILLVILALILGFGLLKFTKRA